MGGVLTEFECSTIMDLKELGLTTLETMTGSTPVGLLAAFIFFAMSCLLIWFRLDKERERKVPMNKSTQAISVLLTSAYEIAVSSCVSVVSSSFVKSQGCQT